MRIARFRQLAVALLVLGATPAWADDDGDCYGTWDLGKPSSIGVASVTAKPRLNFIKSASEQKSCPADTAACRQRAYVVTGDSVVTLGTRGAFTCAVFIGPKGRAAAGWAPTASLASKQLPGAIRLDDWLGEWSGGPEQTIRIKRGPKPGVLSVSGDATFGALDPARVRRGAVNIGEFAGDASPKGALINLTTDETGGSRDAFEPQESQNCSVRMLHLGALMLVEDNFNCGGLNVTFTGGYRRK